MKKIIGLIVLVISIIGIILVNKEKPKKEERNVVEHKGIFITYIELSDYFHNKTSNELKSKVDKIINNLKKDKFNNIYLHVRPFSDAIYESNIFPSSKTIVNNEGEELPLDILEYFIKKSHQNNIKLHAWINPYRISNNTNTSIISIKNPSFKWLGTNNVKVIDNKGIYYNPASKDVEELVLNGVKEIINNYNVDGILYDDYFYPDKTIDIDNYNNTNKEISIEQYRLNIINSLIQETYKLIKQYNKDILFGVSPQGNINNNYSDEYADIKTWLKEKNYLDYIMPQIYFGFNNQNQPYNKVINEWNNLIKNDIDLIIALGLYKSNTIDEYALSGKDEWIRNNNIIKKQIIIARNISNYIGYTIFRYNDFYHNEKAKKEHDNYLKLINM